MAYLSSTLALFLCCSVAIANHHASDEPHKIQVQMPASVTALHNVCSVKGHFLVLSCPSAASVNPHLGLEVATSTTARSATTATTAPATYIQDMKMH